MQHEIFIRARQEELRRTAERARQRRALAGGRRPAPRAGGLRRRIGQALVSVGSALQATPKADEGC